MTSAQRLILIVDDEASVRRMAALMLESAGYAVLTAADCGEALAHARQHESGIDLLLTDLNMPEMDGLTLADQIRRVCPRARVLLMSGFCENLGQARASHYPFLAKPFGMDGLLRSVQAALSATPNDAAPHAA